MIIFKPFIWLYFKIRLEILFFKGKIKKWKRGKENERNENKSK